MTIDEFIEKWNVAYESKEQKYEFYLEMKNDLLSLKKEENIIREYYRNYEDGRIEKVSEEIEGDVLYRKIITIKKNE